MPQPDIYDAGRLELSLWTCPMCWARMWLTRIEPDKPGYDKHAFECTQCKFTMTETVRYR